MLRERGIASEPMANLEALAECLGENVLFVVVVEEVLRFSNLGPINAWVDIPAGLVGSPVYGPDTQRSGTG